MLSRRRFLAALAATPATAADWAAYRGTGDSISAAKNLPLEWGPRKNIAWSVDLPGMGTSAPVVWKDTAFVTSSGVLAGKELAQVSSVDLKTGAQRWVKSLPVTRGAGALLASPTPAVDAGRVFVFFASGDLSALDFDGNILWTRRLGDEFGPLVLSRNGAASVRRSREHVLVFASRESSSFLLAVDPQLGKTDWMAERRSPAAACNTPVVVRSWQREVVTLAAGGRLEGYSAHDGQRLWQLDGLPADLDTPPTPAELPRTGEGVVLLASPSPGSAACYKLLPAGREPERVWRNPDAAAYRCPPLACDGVAYFVNGEGLLLAADLQTGAELWRSALQGEPWASPVAAGERIYFFRRDGLCTVLASGRKLEQLGLNSLDAGGDLHAAVPFDGGFLFRTPNRLIRAGSTAASAKPRYEWRATP